MNQRSTLSIALWFLSLACVPAAEALDDQELLSGEWRITLLVDDGELVSEAEIEENLAENGRLSIKGPLIRLRPPRESELREFPFVLDPNANPKTIDIAGTRKVGGKGIYVVSGDTLMVCLGGAEAEPRPTEMASKPGSQATLIVMQRRRTREDGAETGQPAQRKKFESSSLVGTWGHQDKEKVVTLTFNTDGSYSETLTWKRSFKRLFQNDIRSSGTWKLEDGTVIAKTTASSDKKLANQVFSIRITSLSDSKLVGIDQDGKTRIEWRAP
jgi:uncharacterized protein (TIGR03067 family)